MPYVSCERDKAGFNSDMLWKTPGIQYGTTGVSGGLCWLRFSIHARNRTVDEKYVKDNRRKHPISHSICVFTQEEWQSEIKAFPV